MASFCSFSCAKLPPQTIEGTWQNERTVRTELLSDPEESDSVFAHFDTKQTIVYQFFSDGTFVKTIRQEFLKVAPVDQATPIDEELIARLRDVSGNFSVLGSFKLDRQKIHLLPKEVEVLGIGKMTFSYAQEQNPTFKKEKADLSYSLHPNVLYLQTEDGMLQAFSAVSPLNVSF